MKLQERSGAVKHVETYEAQSTMPLSPAGFTVERRNTLLAYALLLGGLLLLAGRFGLVGGASIALMPGLVLGTIAASILFFAFWQRWYGLLIPGCIVAGLSIGVPLAPLFGGTSVLWGLAAGFLAIAHLGRTYFGFWHPWPIVPAVILFAIGTIVGFAQLSGTLAVSMPLLVPALLIAAGLAYVYRHRTAAE